VLLTLAVLLLAPSAAHLALPTAVRIQPPAVSVSGERPVEHEPGVRSVGRSRAVREGSLWVLHLEGTPEAIGWAHASLMRDEMVNNERLLLAELEHAVRPAPLRWLLLDLAQARYRNVDRGMSDARRREIAAGALGFAPDPFTDVFPTYQRFVYLNALYDIALSFERSPLVGCTSFVLTTSQRPGAHTLLARAFDFDVHDVFDERKAVFFVREDGAIPFASVAWPGLVGVVSGMNADGLALVVHGARAGEPRTVGEPVVHSLRRALSEAHDVAEAVRVFGEREPMVSHIVVAADASGARAVIERVPGQAPYVRQLGAREVVTNHFAGPAASDPKNERVRTGTSTLDREARGQELIAALGPEIGVEDAVRCLRDRRGRSGASLPLGDRRAIDALIAAHGVVFDTTSRTLWVSEAPHLLGRFVAFDLRQELSGARPEVRPAVDADPLLGSDELARLPAANRR
jgi:hypothetical protein